MSERTLGILLGALAVLTGTWLIGRVMWNQGDTDAVAPSPALATFFSGAAETDVIRVRLEGPRDTVTLERQGRKGHWVANGHRADSGAVARFWEAVVAASQGGNIVATSPSNHRPLGVATDSTWKVELELTTGTRSMLVGKGGPRPRTTYLRFPGADTVYLVEGDLNVRVAHTTDDWRDRRILAVDTGAVARIEVELDGQEYAIVRGLRGWTLAGGATVDSATVRTILLELSSLRARGFLAKGDAIALRPYGGSVAAFSAAGDTMAVVTLGADGGDRWARARGDSTLYRLAYYRVERVAPTLERIVGGR